MISPRAHDLAGVLGGGASDSETADSAGASETWMSLRDLLERPELLQAPETIVPRLAFRDRATLIVGGDKAGKTTLMGHSAAGVSRGSWLLDGRCVHGRCVWCGLEEALGDAVVRFRDLNADPDRVKILAIRPPDLLISLDNLLGSWAADLVVIDSLAEWARVVLGGKSPDDGDASAWGSVIRPLVALTREHHVGMGILHHPRRSDGQFRGSGEIAAAADCLWEMTTPGPDEPDQTVRRFRGRARWTIEPWSLRMVDGRYELGAGPVPLAARIIADLAQHPGTSRSAQRERLGCGKGAHDAALNTLIKAGEVVDTGHSRESRLYLPGDLPEDLL